MPVESDRPSGADAAPSLQMRLLGPLTVRRGGAVLALPASRKVRALLAYLSLAPHPVTRGQLCDLLWDVPDDPRGELRWCLCKLRGLVDEPGRRRVDTQADTVRLDLADCFVDAIEVARAAHQDIGTLAPVRLRSLAALFGGDFLDGLEIDRSPTFDAWLTAQRRRFRGCHAALLEQIVGNVPDDEALGHLEKWLELAPFDPRVHGLLLDTLARRGRLREGEEHLAATTRLFEAEGLDGTPPTRKSRRSPPPPTPSSSCGWPAGWRIPRRSTPSATTRSKRTWTPTSCSRRFRRSTRARTTSRSARGLRTSRRSWTARR
jgi:DNA-binding SARP family transcriptional activator